jgi:hypothetical protein
MSAIISMYMFMFPGGSMACDINSMPTRCVTGSIKPKKARAVQLHDGIGRKVFPRVYIFRSTYIYPVEPR